VVKVGRTEFQGAQNIETLHSQAPNLLSSRRTLVFGCRNSVPRSWIPRQCRRPISPSLTTYLYYDCRCVLKFICLFFTKHYSIFLYFSFV